MTQRLGWMMAVLMTICGAARPSYGKEIPPAAGRPVSFDADVLPIFAKYCYSCHGEKTQKAKLRFDQQASVIKGGESGEPVYVVGKSAESHLIKLVAGVDKNEVMPPKGDRLSAAEIGLLRAWIDQGAKWGEGAPGASPARQGEGLFNAELLKHWSFQPVKRTEPAVESDELRRWAGNPIDLFIAQGLQARGLQPSTRADQRTLIRRAYLLLTGLPPTPQQVSAFVADPRADAFDRLVDDLLASPRYGERWARHWLDVVRFAETNGFETNTPRPNAWHYRDYVIRSFNENKPYDRFIKEQLAGDALGEDAATGFLVAGSYDVVKSPDVVLTRNQRANELHDMVSVTGSAFMGLTTGCARCHNHKFDPVSQQDYFAMVAVFAGVQHGDRAIRMPSDATKEKQIAELRQKMEEAKAALAKYEAKLPPRKLPVNVKVNEETFEPVQAKFVRFTAMATNSGAEPCIDELEIFATPAAGHSVNVALASAGAKATSSGDYQGNPKHQLKHINDGQYSNDYSWISNQAGKGWVQIELASPALIHRIVWGRDRTDFFKDRLAIAYKIEASTDGKAWSVIASSEGRLPFGKESAEINAARFAGLPADELAAAMKLVGEAQNYERQVAALSSAATAYAGNFRQPGPTRRHYRGDPMEEREEVAPGAVAALGQGLAINGQTPEQQRRLALADWIIRKDNPLTARVMVNRIWLWHFGDGLVATPSDFGRMGAAPTNLALLDWLADEFVRSGWDVKHLQKLIVTSSTWRQASAPRQECLKVDADSRLLWRFPPRRMEAETIRDNILAVAGTLDLSMGGPGWNAFKPNDNYVRVYTPKENWGPGDWRRMVYMYKVRMEHDATFGAFDCPDAGQPTDKRGRSTTALQALNLLNSEFILQQADLLAKAVAKDANGNLPAQVKQVFELYFSRAPRDAEATAAAALVQRHGLAALCRAMMNSNEFLFVD